MRLLLDCLGGFRVTLDHQPAIFATNPARALLAYLALETNPAGTRAHHRETLTGLLWPDYLESAARLNLSQTLARLRRALADHQANPPFLQITRHTLQLDPATLAVDVWRFQGLLATCTHHPHADLTHCPTCCGQLTAATDLYHGPLLAGELWTDSRPFAEWLLLKRELLQRQALDALHALAVHYEATGAYSQAQQYAERQLALEPWREAAHRQLMRALALSGQRGGALAHYESCRRVLREELDVEPDAATVALVEQIRRGELLDKGTGWQDDKVTRRQGDKGTSGAPLADHPVTLSPPHPLTLSPPHLVIPSPPHLVTPSDPYTTLSRLAPLPEEKLFGVDAAQARLEKLLCAADSPWLVAIDGIGGIGKTTLATRLVQSLVARRHFADIAWVSAKQSEFSAGIGPQSTERPALDGETLTHALLGQLSERPPLTASSPEKRAMLTRLLKAQPYLVVVDNLEAVADYAALAPYLQQLANPSKFLLTSRFSLQAYSGIYCHTLPELRLADALAFVRHEAEVRGIGPLIDAKEAHLAAIYQVVGGNPLALKLVMGQVCFLPLAQVLENLRQAQGQPIHDLYTHIYWQAWQLLDEACRRLFVILPLETNSTYAQLAALGVLTPDQLQHALTQLIALSLVQVSGDLEQPRYRLHRLTETFLMREVLQWQTP